MGDRGIIMTIVIGLLIGIVAKFLKPGKDPGGIIVTILLGIAGALLARYVTPLLGINITDSTWQAYAAATIGAIVLLVIYRLVIARRT